MNKVKVTDQALMMVGDEAIFYTAAGYNPEYNITKRKEYEAVLTMVRQDQVTKASMTNDIGEQCEHSVHYDDFNNGMSTVIALVEPEEYRRRVLIQYEQRVAEARKVFDTEEARAKEHCAERLRLAGVTQ